MHDGWAAGRRRRGSAPRIAAALALHALVLMALKLAIDRVELPHRGNERATLLVEVLLHPAPPPPSVRPLPPPAQRHAPALAGAASPASPAPVAPAQAPTPDPRAITLAPAPAPPIAAAPPPASAPPSTLDFLDNAATRQAIQAAAQGTLASRGNALTHEQPGSELVAADGSHCNCKRNLPRPPPAQALAQDIASAHKPDCLRGDDAGGGMGLLGAPFLLAAEALGKCAHKL